MSRAPRVKIKFNKEDSLVKSMDFQVEGGTVEFDLTDIKLRAGRV